MRLTNEDTCVRSIICNKYFLFSSLSSANVGYGQKKPNYIFVKRKRARPTAVLY